MASSALAATRSVQPDVVRGASRGFTVLLLGGVLQPLAATVAAPVGAAWLPVVAVVAFAVSAWTASASPAARLQHVVSSAMGAYLLVTPLVVLMTGRVATSQLVATSGTALGVAGLVFLVRRQGSR